MLQRVASGVLSAVVGVCGTLGQTACSTHQGQPDSAPPLPQRTEFRLIRDQVFTPPDWPAQLVADVYQPVGAGPFPAMLLIHGGGWDGGERKQYASIARRLAQRGYAVVNTTYRLAPAAIFPAQLQDVQQAVVWMREQADVYGFDADRIGAVGYSAGAHLACLLASVGAQEPLGRPGAQVRVVIAGGAPTDLTKWPGGKLVEQFIGGARDEQLVRYRAASPVTHVSAGDPPVFLYHGDWDRLVPPDHTTDYAAALQAAGVPHEVFMLRGRGHITAFLTDGAAIDAAIAFLDRWMRNG